MTCDAILFASRLIQKCFRQKFLYIFEHVKCVITIYDFVPIQFDHSADVNVREVFCATLY